MEEPQASARGAGSRARVGWRLLRGRRLTSWTEVRRMLVDLLLAWLVLSLTIWVVPGLSASTRWDVLVAAALLGVLTALLRPLVTSFALLLGWVGVLLAGVFAEAALFALALVLSPGITVSGFWPAFWGSWLFALLTTTASWVGSAGDDTAFLSHLLAQSRPAAGSVTVTSVPGVVFIQIDGLAAPLLQWGIRSGNLPTMTRWVRTGTHALTEWQVQLPSTTPASQAGLLHGASAQVPAFRWYEKENGALMVASKPKDAHVIQQRLTDGRGLLADGGTSISNIFTGDAPTALLTMSAVTGQDARRAVRRRGPSRGYAAFFTNPYGLCRSLVLSVAEMVKEKFQAQRQRQRGVEPRIDRHGSYVLLRAVTNVLLRDLNAGLIVEQMMAGTPSVYTDFTDYDEIAHHAGPTRPESMASLAGLDQLLGVLESAATHAPRPYAFVVLSDHGQSQGATFRQRHGQTLEELVRGLMEAGAGSTSVMAATGVEETAGPANTFLSQVGSQGGATGHAVRRALRHRSVDEEVHLEGASHDGAGGTADRPGETGASDVVVIASGNLSMVWFPGHPGRMTREEVEAAWPGLLPALVAHPGIGYVVVQTRAHGLVALGRDGTRYLEEDRVEGRDPLAPFGEAAPREVLRHARLDHVGDLVLNSAMDPGTGEVAAFEELVGNHGGLGGWQTQAVLLHPAAWPVQDAPLRGADAVHHQLVRWLRDLGHRQGVDDGQAPAAATGDESSALREARPAAGG
ncbi:phage holin family protein [Oryzihumus sp.]|uniref:phage holin family protein n=1 Tax=Oryzihumus sp. TaxID=1968903 RepID=UPI002EDA0496